MENMLDFDQAKFDKAHKTIEDCQAKHQAIQRARTQLDAEVRRAKTRLAELEGESPILLARRALGEVSGDEILSVKLESKECREIVEDSALAVQGFARLGGEIKEQSRKAQDIITKAKAMKEYTKLKAELKESFDEAKLTELRKSAHMVSAYGAIQRDLGNFVQELQQIHKL